MADTTQRDADRFMVRLHESTLGKLPASTSWSPTRTRYEKHLTEAGFIAQESSPKRRKWWWVLTPAGLEALPAALERHRAHEKAVRARQAVDELTEHQEMMLGRAADDLLTIARGLAAFQVPDGAPDDMPLNEPLTAGMVRAARAAVAIADTPQPPEN